MRELRKYQKEAIEKNKELISQGLNPLTIMATGTGKTAVMAAVTKWMMSTGVRTLVMAHREILLNQIEEAMIEWAGVRGSREQRSNRANWRTSQLILSSPQSLKGNRLDKINVGVGAVIVDEAHRSVTPSMIKVYSHFKSPIILGFTATADRPDGISLSTIFSRIAYQYSMANGIRDGYLSPIIGKQVDDFEINISKIAPRNGDYQDGPLAEALESYMDQIAEAIIRETDGRKKVLCFLPNVHSSMMLHEALERRGEKSDFVHGKKKNDQALSDFRRGKIKYLTSCQLVIEGYDEPEIDCIAMLRPTTSRIIYSQAVGRGTRIAKGKENMLLLEFTYNSSRLDLVSPYELIGEDTSHRVISELKKEKLDGDDIFEMIQERAEKLQDVDYIVQKAFEKLRFSTFDPIDLAAILGVEVDTEAQVVFDGRELTGGVTTKQENYLSRFMIDSKDMTKAQASIMIQALVDKNAIPMGGVATNAQVKYLARLYPGVRMPLRLTKAAAAVLINTKIKKMEMA